MQDNDTDLLRVSDVARRLGVSRQCIYGWVARGDLGALRVGERAMRIPREDLADYLMRKNHGDDDGPDDAA